MTDNSINFWGIYILASVQTKLCIFRKLEDEKTIKIKKSLTPQLWRKSSHTGSWVSVLRDDDELPGTQATPSSLRPLHRTSIDVQVVAKKKRASPLASPPQTNPPRLPRDGGTSVKGRWFGVVDSRGRGRAPALTKASSVRRLCSLVIVVVS